MDRYLKVLGTCLLAVLAVTAAIAPIVQAQEGTLEAEEYPATIAGEQIGTDVFTTVAGTASCSHATYHGEVSGESSSLDLEPTYSGCKAFGLFNATIDMNGCDYRYHFGTTVSADTYVGTMDVVCTGNSEIAITTSVCRVTIPSQNGLGPITYHSVTLATPTDVSVSINVNNQLHYTVDPGCAPASSGTYIGGDLTGGHTEVAFNSVGSQIGLRIKD